MFLARTTDNIKCPFRPSHVELEHPSKTGHHPLTIVARLWYMPHRPCQGGWKSDVRFSDPHVLDFRDIVQDGMMLEGIVASTEYLAIECCTYQITGGGLSPWFLGASWTAVCGLQGGGGGLSITNGVCSGGVLFLWSCLLA